LPGEATTNTPAELHEIYAAHEGCLDSVGIDRPLDFLVNPLDAVDDGASARLCQHHALMQPIGGQSSKYGAAFDLDVISSWTLIGRGTEDTGRLIATFELLRYSQPLIGSGSNTTDQIFARTRRCQMISTKQITAHWDRLKRSEPEKPKEQQREQREIASS
jgi:hypothetical protein